MVTRNITGNVSIGKETGSKISTEWKLGRRKRGSSERKLWGYQGKHLEEEMNSCSKNKTVR
jgi:hypothetical protein